LASDHGGIIEIAQLH